MSASGTAAPAACFTGYQNSRTNSMWACRPPSYTRTMISRPFVDVCSLSRPVDIGEVNSQAYLRMPFTFRFAGDTVGPLLYAFSDGFITAESTRRGGLTVFPDVTNVWPLMAVFGTPLYNLSRRLCTHAVTSGTSQSYIIQWSHVWPLQDGRIVPGDYNFEIILYNDNSFEFVYGEMRGARPGFIGVKDLRYPGVSGCDGPAPTFTCVPTSNTAIRFTPVP